MRLDKIFIKGVIPAVLLAYAQTNLLIAAGWFSHTHITPVQATIIYKILREKMGSAIAQ
ncbi:hypothetical protein [Nostoc sp. C052]|uniref:hypothetical protein n=1 Tax=Nostoc sp. C052 TaxID=2576902 RepID=UPI001C4C94CE|nr:hypothetical protein [Nostoc sp. C052]